LINGRFRKQTRLPGHIDLLAAREKEEEVFFVGENAAEYIPLLVLLAFQLTTSPVSVIVVATVASA